MQRFKISDGDLIIVSHAQFEGSRAARLVIALETWVSKRGLQEVQVVTSDNNPKDTAVSITVLTVNNVFESEVLDK